MRINADFKSAITVLREANEGFSAGKLSSVAHSGQRQVAISAGLIALARSYGATLQSIYAIDSRGEVSIKTKVGPNEKPFGRFAAVLNKYRPRCGVLAGATLLPESTWCWMNHFDAERLLLEQAALAGI